MLVFVGGGALVLSGCSTGGGEGEGSGDANVTITTGYEQEFSAYNNNTGSNNATKNQIVLNQVLPSFWEFGANGEVQPIKEFGSYEKTADSPLTVKYSINDKAIWSDDDPIDCDDFVLQYAAMSGKFKDAGFNPATTSGVENMKAPECKEGDKEVTVVYEKPYADWVAALGGTTSALMPAHIVEKQTGVKSVVDAVKSNNAEDLKKIATFWNDGWSFAPGQLKKEISPSSGPYMLDSWKAGESITLKANPKWWGDKPKANTVVVRFIEQTGQPQALQNGEIQISEPQPNADVLNQLNKIGDSVNVLQGDLFTFEHLDYNFKGQFKDPNLRKAFALCVPRQEIVDKLVKTVNPEAELLQSRFLFPFQPTYADAAKKMTDGTYDKVNLAEAQKLMGGKKNVTVNIGYIAGNQRRANTVALIKASCDQVGFNVVDKNSPTFFDAGGGLDSGDFDVALFAWAGSPLVTGSYSTYLSTGTQNKGKYVNANVDKWITELNGETDKKKQIELIEQLDKQMWDDLATIPLFAHPGLAAHSSNVEGVKFQPSQSQIEWNMQQWATKS